MTQEGLTDAQLQRIHSALASVPYAQLLGIELEEAAVGSATVAMDVRPEFLQNNGVVHGGAIASLVDTATAFAILSVLTPEERVTTVDLTLSYLRPVTEGRLRATASVVRAGRRLIVVSAEVYRDDAKLTTTALSTYTKL
ncbi:MAG TPA: PaaI family thioesterase [Pyrinomonadaceae bacterium]|nr:PaaI family thioesterase [Pyrinomonadaceae bacterium]